MSSKGLLCILTMVISLLSCQQLNEYPNVKEDCFSQKQYAKSRTNGLQKPYFPDGWQHLSSYSEKLDVLQFQDEILKSLSTKHLVDVCMDFPLAYDCFFFNDLSNGFEQVVNNFNGYQELSMRPDAKIEIINYYLSYVESIYYNMVNELPVLSPFKLAFIELMVQSDYFGDLTEYAENVNLRDALFKAELLRADFEEFQGPSCSTSYAMLTSRLDETHKEIRLPNSSTVYTMYTRGGLVVKVRKNVCGSIKADRDAWLNLIKTYYPNVEIVGDATCEYNCHGYAWWVTDRGTKYWINCSEPPRSDGSFDVFNITNVSQLWSDGRFEECSQEEADHVFYDDGADHSAIVISHDLYESKWGNGYLVRHKPDDCPFKSKIMSNKKRYFKKVTPPDRGPSSSVYYGDVEWSRTPDPIPLGTKMKYTVTYNIDPEWFYPYYDTEVYVTTLKDEEDPIYDSSICEVSHVKQSKEAEVTFNKRGNYYVWFKVIHKASGHVEAVYQSEQMYVL